MKGPAGGYDKGREYRGPRAGAAGGSGGSLDMLGLKGVGDFQ